MAYFQKVSYVLNLIDSLKNHVNNDVNVKLSCLQETVACTAPELLTTRLYALYEILRNDCASNNDCKRIYHEGLTFFYDALDRERYLKNPQDSTDIGI